jgi:translation elongation factor EF-Tu-like GTPase
MTQMDVILKLCIMEVIVLRTKFKPLKLSGNSNKENTIAIRQAHAFLKSITRRKSQLDADGHTPYLRSHHMGDGQ